MKKITILITGITVLLLSCAPLNKKNICNVQFERLKLESKQAKKFYLRGNLFVHGIYLVFYGTIGSETKLTFRSPFGKKLFDVFYTKNEICVRLPNSEPTCGEDLKLYWDYLNINLPFDIQSLLTGKFKFNDKASYQCNGNNIIILNNNAIYLYEDNKIKEIKYKDFTAKYFYDGYILTKIVIYENDVELFRIYIRELKVI